MRLLGAWRAGHLDFPRSGGKRSSWRTMRALREDGWVAADGQRSEGACRSAVALAGCGAAGQRAGGSRTRSDRRRSRRAERCRTTRSRLRHHTPAVGAGGLQPPLDGGLRITQWAGRPSGRCATTSRACTSLVCGCSLASTSSLGLPASREFDRPTCCAADLSQQPAQPRAAHPGHVSTTAQAPGERHCLNRLSGSGQAPCREVAAATQVIFRGRLFGCRAPLPEGRVRTP
jgi:hypothetical protein